MDWIKIGIFAPFLSFCFAGFGHAIAGTPGMYSALIFIVCVFALFVRVVHRAERRSAARPFWQ